jgi:hypothetical protein
MKLRQYIELLNGYVNDNPDALDYEIMYRVYNSNDPYNRGPKYFYGRLPFDPELGEYTHDYYNGVNWNNKSDKPNAICINGDRIE